MSKTNWTQLVWGGLIFVILAGLFVYGLTNRPLIDYKMNCPQTLGVISEGIFLQPSIDLNFRNRGEIDSVVNIVVKSENVTIEPQNKKPFVINTSNSIKYFYILYGGDNTVEYSTEKVYVKTNESIDQFSIQFLIEKRFQLSFSGFFSIIFGEKKGSYPTVCVYRMNKDYSPEFKLVEN